MTDKSALIAEYWSGLIRFKPTEVTDVLLQLPDLSKVTVIFAGNRAGKTSSVAYQYVMRAFGLHPSVDRTQRTSKVRCMSSSLPESDAENEDDNAQYIELKRLIPPDMIVKDITNRTRNLVVRRPPGITDNRGNPSKETVFEFRSSKQELQDLGKINISSLWNDEETPKIIRDECKARLIESDGDEFFTVTLTNPLSYAYDDLWLRASYIYRTRSIVEKFGLPREERPTDGNKHVAAIQMATDDNPILELEAIERIFEDDDEATQLLRRYGMPAHITGRIHKTYNPTVNYISQDKYFPDGVPYNWMHTRAIDYHESRTPWSVIWLSASPEDEWFAWQEFHPAIDGSHAYTTYDISRNILRNSDDYIYTLNKIDPLANKKQPNTGTSATEDLNRHFHEIRRDEGLGTEAYWTGWDTKGTTGRSEVAKRFKNASRVGRPFNNAIRERGVMKRLPTLWITTGCPETHKSVMNWRYGEYVAQSTRAVNDPKTSPQQKFSHDCMCLEALAKERTLMNAAFFMNHPPSQAKRTIHSVTGR